MCGIVVQERIDGKRASKSVLKRYRQQKGRGQDGFGYIAIEGGKVKDYVRTRTEKEMETMLQSETAPFLFFHHRFPTSTINVTESAHPLKIAHDSLAHDYYVIHNGVINNDEKLKPEHEKLGFEYQTEITEQYCTKQGDIWTTGTKWNDSETLAIELALAIEQGKDTVGTYGSAAIVALQVEKGKSKILNMYFARNDGSPLKLYSDKTLWQLTSEGKGLMVETGKLFAVDMTTRKITSRAFTMPSYTYSRSLYDYSGYTHGSQVGFKTPKTGLEIDWDKELEEEIASRQKPSPALTDAEWYADENERINGELGILEGMLEDAKQKHEWKEAMEIQKEISAIEDEKYYVKLGQSNANTIDSKGD